MYTWGHNRRFNSYSNYFRKEFGERIQKLSIDAGFTCPNRDGSERVGGCTFCNNKAFNPSYCLPEKSVTQQINEGIEFHRVRYKKTSRYIAYFQAYTNTYAPIDHLRKTYDEAIAHPDIIGIVVGTRPDCVNDEILEYFKELSRKCYLIIEYGIESTYNKTLERINRGHTFEQSVKAIEQTAMCGIKTGGHMIIGLPGETRDMIMKQAKVLSALPINNIKFHQLQLMKGTAMVKEYKNKPTDFYFYDVDEYIDLMVDFLERLNPKFVVERIAGEAPPRFNLTPKIWGLRNDQIINLLEKRLEQRDTWQGRLFDC